MGLFSTFFGNTSNNKNEESDFPWIELSSLDQFDEIKENSKTKTQFIFKHSTTCGISRMVLRSFMSSFNLPTNEVALYYLDLHKYKEVSNEVGYTFQIMHQSPQLLIIKNGVAVANASHGSINDINLSEYL